MGSYRDFSDQELYALLARNDEEAFTMLYQKYWKRMLYKAMLKLNSDTDAEEVVQDAFIDIWNSRHRIQIQHTFHTYLAAIVRYKIMAKMAGNKKQVQQASDDVYQLQVVDDATQEWLRFADLKTEIERTVQSLPQKCQLVFRMSREDGMSDRQIAEQLELSQKTVEAHLSKALKTLRGAIRKFIIALLSPNFLMARAGNWKNILMTTKGSPHFSYTIKEKQ